MVNSAVVYGQWLGRIQGTNSGYALLNIDRDRPTIGWLQVDDSQQPFSAFITLDIRGPNITGEITRITAHGMAQPDITLPSAGKVLANLNGDTLTGNWQTNVSTSGTFKLQRSERIREYAADRTMHWREFQQWILDESEKLSSIIFRGHTKSTYVLRTSFHRTGRRNLSRYVLEDVPRLCRHVEATLDTRYNLEDPNDFGGLLYLAQHHGFPTPLLDWTTSPFVAAYFAFANAAVEAQDDGQVRVLSFDVESWPHNRVGTIAEIRPTFARLNLRATHNPRALPQQSVPMFSNIVDIEGFVSGEEQRLSRRFLQRIDLPASERSTAMRELATMGVTAGSLFPGLDGICRTLAEKWF